MTISENESAQLLRQADPTELCEWSHTNRTLRHVPNAAVQPADLLVPTYWQRLAGELNQNDILRCIPADSSWFVELLVRDIGPEGVFMQSLRAGPLEGATAPPGAATQKADEETSFYYAGPLLQWQVLSKDGKVMSSRHRTQEDAATWLAQHRKMQRQTTKGTK